MTFVSDSLDVAVDTHRSSHSTELPGDGTGGECVPRFMGMLVKQFYGAKMGAVALALSHALVAAAGSTSATLTVGAVVLPKKEQLLKAAQISVRQPDGTSLLLNAQQQAHYIKDPASIAKLVRGGPTADVVVTLEF